MIDIPKPLLDDIAEGKCLPFVGAGFSLNAKLPDGEIMPDWPGLTRILATAADATDDNNGPNVASEYEQKFGRVQLIETIRHALKTDIIEPGKAQQAFVQLPFDTIYTTNFDLLLEDALQLASLGLVGLLEDPLVRRQDLPSLLARIADGIPNGAGELCAEDQRTLATRTSTDRAEGLGSRVGVSFIVAARDDRGDR